MPKPPKTVEPKSQPLRLPSFNDFSPGILGGDIRPALQAIVDNAGNDEAIHAAWAAKYFDGVANKRSTTNIPATLSSTGLTTGKRPLELSDIGKAVRAAPTAKDAAFVFCSHILKAKNGMLLLQAIQSLNSKGLKIKKDSLQTELKLYEVQLATATTDHTTLKNWFEVAGLVDERGAVVEAEVKRASGVSVGEANEFDALPPAQQVFLQVLRRLHLTSKGPFATSELISECLEMHPDWFDADQFAKQVRAPLVKAGWIDAETGYGKSGKVSGTSKLLDIPIEQFIPNFDAAVPHELKMKLQTPLSEIQKDLKGADKNKGGIALELLALKMVLDLGLDPRGFRVRSSDTAHSEVDLVAEGAHLMFSRWVVQCKRHLGPASKVPLSDVAKEVGIAVYSKAHVVMVVTTGSFTSSACDYANSISNTLPLQFFLVNGNDVKNYLAKGRGALRELAARNAKQVMVLKRGQPLAPAEM